MGESDRVEELLARARKRLQTERASVKRADLAQASPYIAPAAGGEQVYQAEYSAGREASKATSARRYTGRSAGGRVGQPKIAGEIPRAGRSQPTGDPVTLQPISIRSRISSSVRVPWSLRLVLAVSLVSALLLAWRLPGLSTPPVDAPLGVEATHAAFVNVLTGRVASPLDSLRLLPPPAPWYGAAPVVPASALPVYSWLVALVMGLFGAGAWMGRIISIVFSAMAGLFLFATVRRAAGARAAIYTLLLYSVAPLSVTLGQEFAPGALILAAQSGTMLAVVRWRMLSEVGRGRSRATTLAFVLAIVTALFLGLIDPGAFFLAVPAVYLIIAPSPSAPAGLYKQEGRPATGWTEAWRQSRYQGQAIGIAAVLAGSSLAWWLFSQGSVSSFWLGLSDGGAGASGVLAALLNGGTYIQIVGLSVERVLTVAGLLLLGAGLLHAARPPMPLLFHVWISGSLLHVLFDASRLQTHDDVLLPILLPACALAGIGAAWAGALPARLWLAVKEQKRDHEADYAISPHTAWLLDLPEERVYEERLTRPQAQLALSKSVAQRTQTEVVKLRRAWLLAAGHIAVVTVLGFIVAGGASTVFARLQPSVQSANLAAIGVELAAIVPPEARIIVAGPHAPELFYASGHTGWALAAGDFSIAQVQSLQGKGATYLLSADQDWLGKHPDYRGLITAYSVRKLARDYILFDLTAKPSDSDRLYFLESGHTLGGAFHAFWEQHGGVAKLGYPISEELEEKNPLDGELRTVQYFERAVLEYHKENEGTPNAVMLASVGRWVTQGRNFPRVEPFENTEDRWYFAETGHMVKQAFLRYWQHQGGLAMYGYPISEELPEINPGDGKVYTVQYFERARFEWHPTFAGTPDEVQLGLVGKQALEMPRK